MITPALERGQEDLGPFVMPLHLLLTQEVKKQCRIPFLLYTGNELDVLTPCAGTQEIRET